MFTLGDLKALSAATALFSAALALDREYQSATRAINTATTLTIRGKSGTYRDMMTRILLLGCRGERRGWLSWCLQFSKV